MGASTLLHTTYAWLAHASGARVLRAGAVTLPADVAAAASAVFGLHGLPVTTAKPATGSFPHQPADVTPAVIYETYSVGGVTVKPSTGTSQAVAEFQGQFFSPAHLKQFFAKYVSSAPAEASNVSKIVGGNTAKQVTAPPPPPPVYSCVLYGTLLLCVLCQACHAHMRIPPGPPPTMAPIATIPHDSRCNGGCWDIPAGG